MSDTVSSYVSPDLSLLGPEHVKRYRETNGAVGHIWNGVTALILNVIGRKSGELRSQPMIYGRDGENYIVIASYGGAPKDPAWYLNLMANPDAEIQVKDKIIKVRAATVEDAKERARLWKIMASMWPNYDQYVLRTNRKIPVVLLRPR
jgi:deazaflavin-dependent oxidoreductase (nitroreductase family)